MATTNDLEDVTGPGIADFEVILKSISTKDAEGDSRPSILCTASSTDIDLATDRFSLSALQQMKDQFPDMTIFLNHQYRVPEDVFGVVKSAELVSRDGHTDLDLVVEVETANARAVDTYSMVKSGTTLGVSVGVLVMDADVVEDADTKMKVLEITDIKALEASIVGIPANRRSWVQGAMKAASALAAKGGPIRKLADGTMMVPLKDGTVVKMKSFEDEPTTASAEAVVDPSAAVETTEAAASDPDVTASDANRDAAAASPDAPVPDVETDDEEAKQAAKKPSKGDGDAEDNADNGADEGSEDANGNKKPGKGKAAPSDFAAKFASIVGEIETKGLTGEAAARALCDKLYSLIWSMYDALFTAFSAESTIDEKRASLVGIIDEFSTVSKRLCEGVIDDYFGEPDGDADDASDMNGEGGDRTMSFVKAWKAASAEKQAPPVTTGVDAAEVSKLMEQANVLIASNRELTTKNGELEAEVTNQKGLVTGMFEAVDILMSMPLARKINDAIVENAEFASYKEMFPGLDDRILSGMAAHKAKDRK